MRALQPAFEGCVVSTTGLSEGAREQLRSLVELNGGAFAGELARGVATHLVAAAGTDSEKLRHALWWRDPATGAPQVAVVSPDWVLESARLGDRQREALFPAAHAGGGGPGGGGGAFPGPAPLLRRAQPGGAGRPAGADWGSLYLSPARILFTGFAEAELASLTQLAAEGGATCVEDAAWATHTVAAGGRPGCAPPGGGGSAAGVTVGPDWLVACADAGALLPPASFALGGAGGDGGGGCVWGQPGQAPRPARGPHAQPQPTQQPAAAGGSDDTMVRLCATTAARARLAGAAAAAAQAAAAAATCCVDASQQQQQPNPSAALAAHAGGGPGRGGGGGGGGGGGAADSGGHQGELLDPSQASESLPMVRVG